MSENAYAGKQKKRDISLDVINIIACVLVISLHHNGMVHSFEDTIRWRQSLAVECIGYCAVPLFLMISGANLIGYPDKYSTKVFFQKRIVRTFVPWLFWSIVILILNVHLGLLEIEPFSFRNIVDLIINYKVESVYWFFGTLFACYPAIPVLSAFRRDRKMLWYIALLNFIFLSLLPVINQWLGLSWSLDIPVIGSTILFFILGYLFYTERPAKRQRILIYAAGVFGLAFRWIYTYHFSVIRQTTDTTIKGYIRFHSVFYACAVFVLLNQIGWNRLLPEWMKKAVTWLSGCSFGIFLIHRRVMYFEMKWFRMNGHRLAWRTVFIIVTYLVCLTIVTVLRKIKVLKWTVGG